MARQPTDVADPIHTSTRVPPDEDGDRTVRSDVETESLPDEQSVRVARVLPVVTG